MPHVYAIVHADTPASSFLEETDLFSYLPVRLSSVTLLFIVHGRHIFDTLKWMLEVSIQAFSLWSYLPSCIPSIALPSLCCPSPPIVPPIRRAPHRPPKTISLLRRPHLLRITPVTELIPLQASTSGTVLSTCHAQPAPTSMPCWHYDTKESAATRATQTAPPWQRKIAQNAIATSTR